MDDNRAKLCSAGNSAASAPAGGPVVLPELVRSWGDPVDDNRAKLCSAGSSAASAKLCFGSNSG